MCYAEDDLVQGVWDFGLRLMKTVLTEDIQSVPLSVWLQLSEAMMEGIVPFDAASEIPVTEQRTEAMIRIQDALLARTGPESLGLLRAAR